MQAKTPEEIAAGRKRIQELFESRSGDLDRGLDDILDSDDTESDIFLEQTREQTPEAQTPEVESIDAVAERAALPGEAEAESLMARSRSFLERMHEEDREEAIDLHERIEGAIESGDATTLAEASRALTELLFFFEGHIGGRPN
jgi:hypothetical protein